MGAAWLVVTRSAQCLSVIAPYVVNKDYAFARLKNGWVSRNPRADAFSAMVAKGRKAWADVPGASEWVEEQRGAA